MIHYAAKWNTSSDSNVISAAYDRQYYVRAGDCRPEVLLVDVAETGADDG